MKRLEQRYVQYVNRTCVVATDLQRRLQEHNDGGAQGARYTRARRPVTLVYSEPAESRSAACRREAAIKKLRKAEKKQLVSG